MSNAPYCEHPECHATRTANYQHWYGTATTKAPTMPRGVSAIWSSESMPGWHRLCRIHALLRFRFAVGS